MEIFYLFILKNNVFREFYNYVWDIGNIYRKVELFLKIILLKDWNR